MRKEYLVEKAAIFPQVFMVLPITDGRPEGPGPWAAYPNDEATLIWINTSHPEAQKFYSEQLKNEEIYKMSKELTVNEDKTIKSMIAANMKAIKSILPKHITPERFARIAYTSIVTNPKLARCSQMSLINAVIESSTIGLEIGGAMKEACLIPFKNSKTNTYEATLVIEYPGLIKLAKNTGEVKNISAHPVFGNDEFRYNYGLNPDLIHIPSSDQQRGDLTHAYCIIWYINGGVDFEVIGPPEAETAKGKSATKFKKDSPWNQEENVPAMWVKTSIRRIMKRVPKAAEQRFIQVDGMSGAEMNHVGDNQDIINLSPDDFYSVGLNNENSGDQGSKNSPKTKSKPKEKQKAKEQLEELSKDVKNAIYLADNFPGDFKEACKLCKVIVPVGEFNNETAIKVCAKVGELVDKQQ